MSLIFSFILLGEKEYFLSCVQFTKKKRYGSKT